MSQKCRGWLDYGKRKKCPVYDVDNCSTPHIPPACPLKDLVFKRPCYRFRCSNTSLEFIDPVKIFFVENFNYQTYFKHCL